MLHLQQRRARPPEKCHTARFTQPTSRSTCIFSGSPFALRSWFVTKTVPLAQTECRSVENKDVVTINSNPRRGQRQWRKNRALTASLGIRLPVCNYPCLVYVVVYTFRCREEKCWYFSEWTALVSPKHFFPVQRLHGFRQVVQHVQLHVAKLDRMVNWCKHRCLLIE